MLLSLVAEAASSDPFPWPVSLGISVISIGSLISFFVWQNKQISTGRWVPREQVDLLLSVKDREIDTHKTVAAELREALAASEQGREKATEIAKKAVESNKLSDHFYETFMPRLARTPRTGDTGVQEVTT